MPNIKSAIKRARQNITHRERNVGVRSMFRTYIKNVVKAIASGNKSEAQAAFLQAQVVIDKTAQKGFIHKNKAARHKSRLSAHIKAMQA